MSVLIYLKQNAGTLRVRTGTVEAQEIQKTVDFPNELGHGFKVTLDDGMWVTVRQDQVML